MCQEGLRGCTRPTLESPQTPGPRTSRAGCSGQSGLFPEVTRQDGSGGHTAGRAAGPTFLGADDTRRVSLKTLWLPHPHPLGSEGHQDGAASGKALGLESELVPSLHLTPQELSRQLRGAQVCW